MKKRLILFPVPHPSRKRPRLPSSKKTTYAVCAVMFLALCVNSLFSNNSISKKDLQQANQDYVQRNSDYVDGWNWYVDNVGKYGPMACVYYRQPTVTAGEGCADASNHDGATYK